MCSEASYLSSGFSGYARELLKRLYATNKYEVAEFASYAKVNDPRDSDIPWMLYANAPADNDPRSREYNSNSDTYSTSSEESSRRYEDVDNRVHSRNSKHGK